MVKIINPADQSVADVPESSLPHHYRAGWALLDESPEPEPAPDPKPVRAKKAAAADSSGDTKESE
jgi:8-oxo-dGTP pyrophosphatase MutT (NUDIX family)